MNEDILQYADPAEPKAPSQELPDINEFAIPLDPTADQAKSHLILATDSNPDNVAKSISLSKKLGIAQPAIEQDTESYAQIDQLNRNRETVAANPKLQAWIAKHPLNAKVAADDVENLGAIEQVLNFTKGTGLAIASAVPRFNQGAWGVGRAVADLLPDFIGDPLAEDFASRAARLDVTAKGMMPKSDNIVESSWYSGMQSLGLNVLQLPLGLGGKMSLVLTAMGLTTGGQSYTEARDKGLGVPEALVFGTSQGVIEAGTEMIGLPALFSMLKPGQFITKALEYTWKEQFGEQIATHLQDLNEWAALHPEKSVQDYLDERPNAALQTALATLFGTGGQVAIMKGVEKAVNRLDGQAQQAEQAAQVLTKLDELVKASKVRGRDAESFEQFLQSATEEGPIQDVFISAETLAQSGIAEKLAEVSPAVAQQFEQALVTGGDVRIPIAEYTAKIAGTEYSQGLIDHLKTEPEGLSRAEAKQFMDTQAETLQAEVDRVMAEKQVDDTFRASTEAVKADIKTQLDTAARFTSPVHDTYAGMVSNFYAVTGAKLGITPQELYARYPLRIQAEDVTGGQVMSQGAGNIADVSKKWSDAGIINDVAENKGVITLSRIVVPESERVNGKGTAAMQELIDYADRTGQRVVLSPSADFGGNKKRLSEFYKRFGFVENKGKNKDYSTKETMIREPQQLAQSGLAFPNNQAYGNNQGGQNEQGRTQTAGGRDGIGQQTQQEHGTIGGGSAQQGWADATRARRKDGPAKLYRGSSLTLNADHFGLDALGKASSNPSSGLGVWLTTGQEEANTYGSVVEEFHLDVRNPKVFKAEDLPGFDSVEEAHTFREKLRKAGHDGIAVIFKHLGKNETHFVAFDAGQVIIPQQVYYQSDSLYNRALVTAKAQGRVSVPSIMRNLRIPIDRAEALVKQMEADGYIKLKSQLEGTYELTDKINQADLLFQTEGTAQDNRGSFSPSTNTITLLKNADLSTFLHEAGHFFLEVQFDIAARGDTVPAKFLKDTQTLLNWFGVKDLSAWENLSFEEKRSYHEKFARGFESYLFEGKAPNLEMQSIFQRVREWMLNVYKELKNLNVELSDEVRGVFDRMVATDEQIALAEQGRSMMPLFVDQTKSGISKEAFAEYQNLGKQATDTAIQELQAKGMRDMQWLHNAHGREVTKLQKKSASLRHEVQMEARKEVMSQQVYQVWQFLTGKEVEGGEEVGKFSLSGLDEIGAAIEVINHLKAMRMTAEDGFHPDLVAETFGFSSGDELVRLIASITPPKEAIENRTDQKMLEQHGELATPEAIERAADMAIHNELRAKVIATEYNALAKALGEKEKIGETKNGRPIMRKILPRAAREFAANIISKLQIRNILPSQYAKAEVRAAKAAEKASKKGDLSTAAAEKRNQLINNYATKAAYEAQEEVDKGVKYLNRITSETALKNMRGDAKAQLLSILDRFDIRKSLSLKEIDKQQSISAWVESEAERLAAPIPELSDAVKNEAIRTHYKNLTMEEFRGLLDSIKQLEHMARREHKAYITIRNMTLQEEVANSVAEIRDAWPKSFDVEGKAILDIPLTYKYARTTGDRLSKGLQHMNAEFVPMEELVDQLTAGKFGLLHDSLFGRLSDASDRKSIMAGEIRKRLKPFYDTYSMKEKRDFSRKVVGDTGMTRENLLMLMLYYGNVEGRQRLASQGFNDQQVLHRINYLTEKDINLAEAIWSLNDDYIWPMYQALNERTQGKSPPKVEALPMQINGRDVKGGYVKLVYDSAFDETTRRRDSMEDAMAMIGGRANVKAKTEQGSSIERVKGLSRMPLLELRAMSQAVNEHMHDIAYREAVADTVRVLREPAMRDAIKAVSGEPIYTELMSKVNEIAARPRDPSGVILKGLNIARKNTVVVLMSGIRTALINYSGLIPALNRVNAGSLVKNIAKVHSWRMKEMISFAMENSEYMRERNQQFTSDLQHEMASLTVQNKLLPEMGTFLILMRMIDQVTSTSVWMAAYEDGIAESKDHDRAVEYANNITRSTQGGGRDVDTSKIMTRFGPWSRPFTMFYSFFNRQLALLVRQGVVAKHDWQSGKKAEAIGKFTAAYITIVVLPALINDIASGRCDKAIEGDEGWTRCISKAIAMNMSGYIPIVRDFVPYVWGKLDEEEPNYGLRMTPTSAYLEGVGSGIASTVDVVEGEGDERDTKAIFYGLAYSFGLPGKLMWDVTAGTEAVINEDAPPQSILFGPPKKK